MKYNLLLILFIIKIASFAQSFSLGIQDSQMGKSSILLSNMGASSIPDIKCYNTCTTTSIINNEEKEIELSIYPNPTQNNFNYSFKAYSTKTPVNITLINITGQVLWEEKIAPPFNNFYTGALQENAGEGIYLLQIRQDNIIESKKIIKMGN